MRLKSLKLKGFKSFADGTEFSFPDGITCIVGPNGCGKSNVVDAVKWVLGEQRAKALRGAEMADVIFGGTKRRKPLGMAEVSLIFDNRDHVLDIDFQEVEVTRRLYRDGTSEYLLNRSKCRLRDLRELLMDTGSGPGALTFMEQGRIDQILKESVAERRAVFEEAAGVSRYKARRKETIRRLGRVEEDLLRVSDVVEERQRQVRSLKIQAGRAERYKALLEEMRAKRLKLAVHHYGRLVEQREAATLRVEELSVGEEAARFEVAEAARECEAAEAELERSRVAASSMEKEIATLEGRTENAREKAAFSTRLVAELDGKIRWYTDEIEGFAERLTELEDDRHALAESLAAARLERTRREDAVKTTDEAGRSALEAANALRAEVAELERRHYAALEQQSEWTRRVSELEAEARGLEERAALVAARNEAVAEELRQAGERFAGAQQGLAQAEEAAASAAQRQVAAEERVQSLEDRVSILREGVQAFDRDLSALHSREDVLRALVARMEGVGKGPKRLIEEAAKAGSSITGVRGLLADLLQTDEDRAADVETALGVHATAVVVETLDDAVRAIPFLAERKLGRCVLLPLDQFAATAAPVDLPADARSVLDAVRCGDDVRAAVAALLADSVVVQDLDTALRVRGETGGRLRLVTSDGSIVERTGALVGGGAAGGAGILQRNAELRQIEERLADVTARLEAARTELETAKAALADARREVGEARTGLREADGALHRARGTLERARSETARAEQERDRLAASRGQIEERLGRARDLADEGVKKRETAKVEVAACEAARGEAADRFREAEAASRAAEERRADARVEFASIRERCDALEQRAGAVEREAKELEEGVDEARVELERSEKRKVDSEERGKEARAEMEKSQKRRDACVRELIEVRHAVGSAQKALEDRRGLRKQLDDAAGQVTRELGKFRLRQNEARVRVENLIERIQEELEIDLDAAWKAGLAAAEEPAADAADEDGSADEVVGSTPVFADPLAAEEEEFDPDAIETQIDELKGKLARMGAVNLEALEQLESAQTEAEGLLVHHNDLTKSRDALLEAIKKIDKESRELFVATFETVRTNFREMFRKLFGGGRADVFLEPGVDVLEAGVEVVARPPGKEQRSISLLSGGERTMTAVALMFAIYVARPSPFCLLDEVDAALDEHNVDRFAAAVHEFSEQSQFIIVTHNKRTMQTADTIFGVSMPEPGVSRRLAVRIDDVSDDGQLKVA